MKEKKTGKFGMHFESGASQHCSIVPSLAHVCSVAEENAMYKEDTCVTFKDRALK